MKECVEVRCVKGKAVIFSRLSPKHMIDTKMKVGRCTFDVGSRIGDFQEFSFVVEFPVLPKQRFPLPSLLFPNYFFLGHP